MASNVAGDAADVSSITKPGAKFMNINPRRAISSGRKAHSLSFERTQSQAVVCPFLPAFIRRAGGNGLQRCAANGYQRRAVQRQTESARWMSAENALIYVDNIRDALMKYDPQNAAIYQKMREL